MKVLVTGGAGFIGFHLAKALIRTADDIGVESKVLKAVEARNEEQKAVLFKKIEQHFEGDLSGEIFAVWGLSFKPNTDDMREAPSRVLLEALWQVGAKVQAFDPEAMEETRRIYGERDDLTLCPNKEAALQGATALIIVTEWQNFRVPDFAVIKASLKQPVIFDGRNIFSPVSMAKKGFIYYSIGRPQ